MQTILGAGGAIGRELSKHLLTSTKRIRLASRHPSQVNETDEPFTCDLTDPHDTDKAVEGSEVAYLVAGFAYNLKAWKETWPRVMRNAIESCKRHGARLVFFDNIYMYDRDFLGCMTEDTPVWPSSKKGEIRAHTANMLLSEAGSGKLKALIARSADFIGPNNSVFCDLVIKNLLSGKAAMWIARTDKLHSFTYARDAAKATALLGNTIDAFGEVWHLPTCGSKLTIEQLIALCAEYIGAKPAVNVIPVWALRLLGLFVPPAGELREMAYQYDRDYFFDSSKFDRRFGAMATSPEDSIRETIQALGLQRR